jgi:hypothetical protein
MHSAATVVLAAMVLGHPDSGRADSREALLSGYTMTSWTLADGVPIGPVYAIAQDAEGYLWLGTTSGLQRFDGARFTNWDAIHTTALPRGDVRALSMSGDGTLWVGFDRRAGGVTVAALRNGVMARVSTGAPPTDTTTAIAVDRAGRVWTVSAGALYRLHRGRWDVVGERRFAGVEVVSVREDPRGAIWIGTRQGAFRTHDGDSFELVEAGIARETSEGANGAVWMTDPAHAARRVGARAPIIGIDGWGMRSSTTRAQTCGSQRWVRGSGGFATAPRPSTH